MNKALFLDRDGVINIERNYVYLIKDFIFREEIFKICSAAMHKGYLIIVVTNQAGIGRGFYTESDFYKITNFMLKEFELRNIYITKTYFCPYHPIYGIGKYLKDSNDRKPRPGMLLKASKEYNIELSSSIMIGDKITDKLASENAGIKHYIDSTKEKWLIDSLVLLSSN